MGVNFMRAFRSLANCRLLAVDWGATYTGIASRTCRHSGPQPYGLVERVGDSEWILRREGGSASNSTATRHVTQADAIAHIIEEQRVAACIVGMPYAADGSKQPLCAVVERHASDWQRAWPRAVPMLFWDESFSTRRAVGARRPVPGSRKAKASHALAACVILEEVCLALQPLETALDAASLMAPLSERILE